MNDNRTWRTTVRYDPASDALAVVIGRGYGDYVQYVRSIGGEGGITISDYPLNAAPPLNELQMRIPEDIAKALLEALAEHFGGTGDTRTLRKDYDAERARVDRLVNHLISADQRVEYRTVTS